MAGHGNREINLALDQPESVLLERVQQIGAVRRDLSLYALPGAEVCVLQRRSVIAQTHYR